MYHEYDPRTGHWRLNGDFGLNQRRRRLTRNIRIGVCVCVCWLGGSVVERRSLIGELSLVCTGLAADG